MRPFLFLFAPALALTAACTPDDQVTTGAGDYRALCADCHGADARGNGPAAAGLSPAPPDLTLIARAHDGAYPRAQVMSRIYGYTMGSSDSPMPAFGDLLEGRTVLYDTGDGRQTPTPWRLVALSEYLERLQR